MPTAAEIANRQKVQQPAPPPSTPAPEPVKEFKQYPLAGVKPK